MMTKTKYIFVTGGVVSSLGKGITAASLGQLLIASGLRIRMLKVEPYLNVDSSTMSPAQHGEIYLTDDGTEADLDLGHYERFTGQPTSRLSSVTSGRVYWDVLDNERRNHYNGGTIQMIPHITDEIKRRIRALSAPEVDVVIVEIGGTVGDIEGLMFLEAIRQIGLEEGRENVAYLHITYLPFIRAADELKTKPSQQSVAKLREIGIVPDVLVCRSEVPIQHDIRAKLSLFCNVPLESVIEELDVQHTIYEVPLVLARQGLSQQLLAQLRLDCPPPDLDAWRAMVDNIVHPAGTLTIGVMGKFAELQDAYKSTNEALRHGGAAHRQTVRLRAITPADCAAKDLPALLGSLNGVVIPDRLDAAHAAAQSVALTYLREHRIPLLAIGEGFHALAAEWCASAQPAAAPPSAAAETPQSRPLLGAAPMRLTPDSRAALAYNAAEATERFRNPAPLSAEQARALEKAGARITGTLADATSPTPILLELAEHPWAVAAQFHPEMKSQALHPHPLFRNFIRAAMQPR